ncbi:MAG TPA: hypothetical protein VGT03_11565 [Candidatus Acidoferrales bacterium]|nr:hypothetical protein [Candidatus Acidoferrales bacterium]
MNRLRSIFCKALALLALGLLLPQRENSTTLAQLSLSQLTSAASAIAVATCTGSESLWRDGEVWTVSSFHLEDVWKGELPQELQVWMLGGRTGPVTSYVPGAPRFRPGEETVLFLEPTRSGLLSITGWGEGTFRIRHDPRTGKSRVTQDSASVPAFDPAARRFRASGVRDWPLGRLKERILAAEVQKHSPGLRQ